MYAFFIIYAPPFSELYLGIPTQYIVAILLILTTSLFFIGNMKNKITFPTNNILLFIGVFISAIYFVIRASIEGSDIRILQNLFILVQLSHVFIIVGFLKRLGTTKIGMFKFLLNMATFQAFIGIMMIILPEFKNLALQLYYLGGEENLFISRMRIYGLSGDYTFFTPIYHSILAVVAATLALFVNYKYSFYLPFILGIIILNGRFGILIFILGMLLILFYMALKGKVSAKAPIIIFIMIVPLGILFSYIAIKMPYTYEWLIGGLEDTVVLLTEGRLQGNYVALVNSHVFIPEGLGFIFGEGHRVFSTEGPLRGYNSSDIGYVNDLFMGGMVYVVILYGAILLYLLKGINKSDLITRGLTYSLILALLLANYKGEVMRSGTVLIGVILIKYILISSDEKMRKYK